MADTLSAMKLLVKLQTTFAQTINSGSSSPVKSALGTTIDAGTLTDGTGANQADKYWESLGRTLAQSGTEDIDLYDFGTIDIGGGAGKDPGGQAYALAEICVLLVYNRTTSVGSLLVGGKSTTAAWNAPFNADDDATVGPIGPGGLLLLSDFNAAAFAVADTSNHLLKVAEAGNGAVTYDIHILGRSA